MRRRRPRLLNDAPMTPEERRFVGMFQARYTAMPDWQIAYVVRKSLDHLEEKRCKACR